MFFLERGGGIVALFPNFSGVDGYYLELMGSVSTLIGCLRPEMYILPWKICQFGCWNGGGNRS